MHSKFPELDYLSSSFTDLDNTWRSLLVSNCKESLIYIDQELTKLQENNDIYPPKHQIFAALSLTSLDKIKVVILGQDPYHGAGEAIGLAFAVSKKTKVPPSLRNIYKELGLNAIESQEKELLIDWAKQGVLLLNSTLTVIKDKPNSLANIGWQSVTDKVIQKISDQTEHVVFMLWGSFAQKKAALIDANRHLILTTTHPSPFSAHKGFLGSNHFNLANQYLEKYGRFPINWKK